MSEPTIDARPGCAVGIIAAVALATAVAFVGLLLWGLFEVVQILDHRAHEKPPSMVTVIVQSDGRAVRLDVPRSSIHNVRDCTGTELSVICHALSGNTPVLVRGIDFNH